VYLKPDYFVDLVQSLGYELKEESPEFLFGSRKNAEAKNFIFTKDESKRELELIVARP